MYLRPYGYPYVFPPQALVPGTLGTATTAREQAIRGMLTGAMLALAGGLVGAGVLGVYFPLKIMNEAKLETWAQALIILLVTFPLGGLIGALPGLLVGSVAAVRAGTLAPPPPQYDF